MADQRVKLPSTSVDASDVGDGTISNTEFGYLNGVTSNIQTQITDANTQITDAKTDDNLLRILAALGSDIKAVSFGSGFPSDNSLTFSDTGIFLTCLYLPKAATITGVKFYQVTQGNYTADAENRIGLYTYSNESLTLVASSANNGDVWKAAADTFVSVPFSSTYAASAGLYYVAGIYNQSAQTTAPKVATSGTIFYASPACRMGMSTNKLCANKTGQSALPETVAMNTFSNQTQPIWYALY